jgi:hypothetical protein
MGKWGGYNGFDLQCGSKGYRVRVRVRVRGKGKG